MGDPPILLLDEATSAVDGATEAAFRNALRAHTQERGGVVITIAHRISTAVEADYIFVMDGGRFVEEGTPAELLAGGGHLAALWELENAGWQWSEPASGLAGGP